MSPSYLRSVYLRLTGVLMLIVLVALAVSAYLSHQAFERALVPEMAKKVASGGATVRSLIIKAMEQRIDFGKMYGVEQSFDELKESIREVSYVALTDMQGNIVYQRFTQPRGAAEYFHSPAILAMTPRPHASPLPVRVGDQFLVSMPIAAAEKRVGMLHIGISVYFVDRMVLDMLYDVLIVLVVALFLTLELLHFMVGSKFDRAFRSLDDAFERGASGDFTSRFSDRTDAALAGAHKLIEVLRARVNSAYGALVRDVETLKRSPAHERPPGLAAAQKGLHALGPRFRFGVDDRTAQKDDSQLAKVRAPLFIFILAEEFTRPFLPAYIKELLVPVSWLSPEIVVGLPIALFMFIVAIAQPSLGRYCERVGKRRAMLLGAAIAAFGFVGSALAGSVLDLLLWRSLCAVGYALVFVAGQAHVLEHATTSNRARSFSLFIGAIMVATVCGPPIGGILADNIGRRLTLVVSAVLALASIATIWQLPEEGLADARRAAARMPSLREIGGLLLNRRFMTVTALAKFTIGSWPHTDGLCRRNGRALPDRGVDRRDARADGGVGRRGPDHVGPRRSADAVRQRRRLGIRGDADRGRRSIVVHFGPKRTGTRALRCRGRPDGRIVGVRRVSVDRAARQRDRSIDRKRTAARFRLPSQLRDHWNRCDRVRLVLFHSHTPSGELGARPSLKQFSKEQEHDQTTISTRVS